MATFDQRENHIKAQRAYQSQNSTRYKPNWPTATMPKQLISGAGRDSKLFLSSSLIEIADRPANKVLAASKRIMNMLQTNNTRSVDTKIIT